MQAGTEAVDDGEHENQREEQGDETWSEGLQRIRDDEELWTTPGVQEALADADYPPNQLYLDLLMNPLDGPFFEETIYVTPSRHDTATQQAIIETVEKASAAFGLRHGPIHAELRLGPDGPVVLEVAARSIGGRRLTPSAPTSNWNTALSPDSDMCVSFIS